MQCIVEFEETKSGTVLVKTGCGNYVDASKLPASGWMELLGVPSVSDVVVIGDNSEAKEKDGEDYRLALRRKLNRERDISDSRNGIRFLMRDLSLRERRDFWGAMEHPWVRKTFVNTKSSRHGIGVALTRICRQFGFAYIDCSVRRYHRTAFDKLKELYQSKSPFAEHIQKFENNNERSTPESQVLPL